VETVIDRLSKAATEAELALRTQFIKRQRPNVHSEAHSRGAGEQSIGQALFGTEDGPLMRAVGASEFERLDAVVIAHAERKSSAHFATRTLVDPREQIGHPHLLRLNEASVSVAFRACIGTVCSLVREFPDVHEGLANAPQKIIRERN
jgi:hypothetical protein